MPRAPSWIDDADDRRPAGSRRRTSRNDAHQRPLISEKERLSALNGPMRSNSSAGQRQAPRDAEPDARERGRATNPSDHDDARDQAEQRRPRTSRRSANRSDRADRRRRAQPGVADGLEARDERDQERDEQQQRSDRPKPTITVASASAVVASSTCSNWRSMLEQLVVDRREQQDVEHADGAREDRHDAAAQRLPVPRDHLDAGVEDLPDAQRPQRCRHGREGTSMRGVYAQPPAIAGRITSVSDSPTDVSSPLSTRTSSSLR